MKVRPMMPAMPGTTVSAPYFVLVKGKSLPFSNGRDAIKYARMTRGAEVYHVTVASHHLDYADKVLPQSDKAKPPKGTCGAFCKGETSKVVKHYAAHAVVEVRVY
jgi:hypothetical protein